MFGFAHPQVAVDSSRDPLPDLWTTPNPLVDSHVGGNAGMRDEATDPQRNEDGAALVEFAILAPLLIMLLFGIVTAGLAFNHSISLSHSAREASRQAATLPVSNFGSLNAWLDAVVAQVIDDADGSLDAGVPGRTICVAYVHPSGNLPTDVTASLTRDPAGNNSYSTNACFADGRPPTERRVQVVVERDVDFNVILWSTMVTIDSEGVSRYEAAFGV